MKTIAGVVRPSGGRVVLNGIDVTGKAPERLVTLGMSYVPQLANVFPSLSVAENLEMGGYVRKAGRRSARPNSWRCSRTSRRRVGGRRR